MYQLSVIANSIDRTRCLGAELAECFEIRPVDNWDDIELEAAPFLLIDSDLADHPRIRWLKARLQSRPPGSVTVFAVDPGNRLQEAQACALGATAVLCRPIQAPILIKTLLGNIEGLANMPADSVAAGQEGISSALDALQGVLGSACAGGPVDAEPIERASDALITDMRRTGLASWIETVRKHHSQTYQHSLLVAGTAVAFAQHLGFSQADQQRVSFAALLHDVGKARIPVAILEKPGPLDAGELAIMRQHPVLGYEALASTQSVPAEMLDMVLHHHEYLDGSGYPDGLCDGQISDLVRIMTIADIFGALMERRSYKAPLPAEAAYKIMIDMGGKLDVPLVKAFGKVAQIPRPHRA
jgi:putative nucleotidyltransferase with HDIG domain